ncbi:MAG TPA: PorV/PorQ family protein [candidate division Zixibacteria bacterium]|nr:PorV/PorQ family protein [candidate division Zixibacteria bacterium]
MKSFLRWSVIVGLLVAFAVPVHAVEKRGTAAAKFLTLDSNARIAGLASSASSYTDLGAFSALTNQAGMVFTEGNGAVGVSYTKYFAEMTLFSAAVVWNLGDKGAIGIGVHSLMSGDIPFTTSLDPTHSSGTSFSVTGMAIGPTYARRLTDSFSVGGALKFVSEAVSGTTGGTLDKTISTYAFDAGTIYTTDWHKFRIGATFQNFGPDMKFIDNSNAKQSLPTTFRIGFAAEPAELPVGSIMVSGEIWKLREYESVLNFGVEYWVNDYVAGRVGWKAGYSGGEDEGLSAGVGFKFAQGDRSINLDYAYTAFDLLDDLHRISVGLSF